MENAILLELFLELDASAPEGLRAELIDGEIVVSPPPEGCHAHCLSEIWRQVVLLSATHMSLSGHKGLAVPREGGGPPDRVIPDVTIAPRERRPFRGAPAWMPCDDLAMVVEVTGSRADIDRIAKRYRYARAGIPLHLLVDREHETITLFSEPTGEGYGGTRSTAFGEPLPFPAPFSFVLETSELG
ncbi:Uma2 family endonuclease [Streptomyces klenkii]